MFDNHVFTIADDYSLIVEDGFDYSSIDASIYTIGATIGNNLNNDWDLVILKDNNSEIVDAMSYHDSWGGDDNNLSLCKLPDKEGKWQECASTPGEENGGSSATPIQ